MVVLTNDEPLQEPVHLLGGRQKALGLNAELTRKIESEGERETRR